MVKQIEARLLAIVYALSPEFRGAGRRDVHCLLEAGVHSTDDLIAIVRHGDKDRRVRMVACWALARVGDERAAPVLGEALKDDDAQFRAAAAQSLAELNFPEAIETLINSMSDDISVEVRVAAAYALGLQGDNRALDPFIAKLHELDEQPSVRGMVAEALADLGDRRAVAALIAALTDDSAEVRFWSAFALGRLGDRRALPELRRLAANDTALLPGHGRVSAESLEAIRQIEGRSFQGDHTTCVDVG